MRRCSSTTPTTRCTRAAVLGLVGALALAMPAGQAVADPGQAGQTEDHSVWGASRSLLGHFGPDVARQLLHGNEATEPASARADVLRGIARAVALGTAEGVELLVQLLRDTHGIARSDSVVLLTATRALAPFAAQHPVAKALAEVVLNPSFHPGVRSGSPSDEASATRLHEDGRRERLELARDSAALALAEAHESEATDLLLVAARHLGPGRLAAIRALIAFPPTLPAAVITAPESLALAVALGDRRAADSALEATGSSERATRVLGLEALGAFHDARGVAPALAAGDDPDPRVREAGASTLLDLGAHEGADAVRKLIESDATVTRGLELASRTSGEPVVGALIARLHVSSDLTLRRAAIAALGAQIDVAAWTALVPFLSDALLAGDAAEAIARTASPAAWEVIARSLALPPGPARRLGARMAALRARVRGEDGMPHRALVALRELARGQDSADRSVAIAALLWLGDRDLSAALEDADVHVRRGAVLASDPANPRDARAIARRLPRETDPLTRALLASTFAVADPADVTTQTLLDRSRSGGIDAPFASLALARRTDDLVRPALDIALHSPDAVLRALTARGLGQSTEAWSVGRLAMAYEAETEPEVRLAMIGALAACSCDERVLVRAHALRLASELDPDADVRAMASRARSGLPPLEAKPSDGVLWIRLMAEDGSAPRGPALRGLVVRSDGLAVPVVFDVDGYALVPAPRGNVRLVLAPRVGPYDPDAHDDAPDVHD